MLMLPILVTISTSTVTEIPCGVHAIFSVQVTLKGLDSSYVRSQESHHCTHGGGWLHTEMVYPLADGHHPSKY